MSRVTSAVQAGFAALGLTLRRLAPSNRFDAMADALRLMAHAGFEPTIVVDAGANRGEWARKAAAVFGRASLHLIEPQPACRPSLDAFCAEWPGVALHAVAVTRPGTTRVRMAAASAGSTGAHVLRDETSAEGEWVQAATLDQLLTRHVLPNDRVLLKLDLEGHELTALEGARSLLASVEVIVTETQFYEFDRNGDPTFTELVAALQLLGFAFYDVAALASRPRDGRLRSGDVLFVRLGSPLLGDNRWA
jgi:FkbM family methyltransferase